jgi:hypothetical protein
MDPCRIELESNAKPVKIPTRQLPVAYWENVKLELEKLKKDGIIVKLSEAVDWCSPLVISHLKIGKIRQCADWHIFYCFQCGQT